MSEIKRYRTPVFRASFPQLFEARSYNNGEPKFSVAAVWRPSDFTPEEKKLWVAIKRALDAESMQRFKKKAADLPRTFKVVPRDGAEKELEGYGPGTKFANLSTKMAPGVVGPDMQEISVAMGNTDLVYPGCFMRATVTVYSYDNQGKGIALGLGNVQKVRDGERLDSRTAASEDFEKVDGEFLDDADDYGEDGDEEEPPF